MEKVYYKLIQIKGIGPTTASKICTSLGISLSSTYNSLSPEKFDGLNLILGSLRKLSAPTGRLGNGTSFKFLDNFGASPIEFSLFLFDKKNILQLIELNTYRGRRHKLGYPVHGQRTRSNAKTARRLNKSRIL